MADLWHDFESNRCQFAADYWLADCACCHAVDCYLALTPDACASALGSVYFHYYPISAFLYHLQENHSQHIGFHFCRPSFRAFGLCDIPIDCATEY